MSGSDSAHHCASAPAIPQPSTAAAWTTRPSFRKSIVWPTSCKTVLCGRTQNAIELATAQQLAEVIEGPGEDIGDPDRQAGHAVKDRDFRQAPAAQTLEAGEQRRDPEELDARDRELTDQRERE